jgi:hypothetical protein
MAAVVEPIETQSPPSTPDARAGWLENLEERSPPHFNQFVIWVLLASGVLLACWPFAVQEGARQPGPVSLLSWLPDAVIRSPYCFAFCRIVLLVGTAAWLAQKWLPWSCWLVVVGFTGLWSLHVETTYNTAHIFHMANMLLVIQAIWITADAPLVRQRLADGAYWQQPIVPRWVSVASIAYIGLFHTAAGLSKLFLSGPSWANGTSLQLWTYLWGRPWMPTTQAIIASRSFTQGLQWLTLVVETAGILAIFPRLRPWIGVGLLGFYAGVLATFDYGFQLNALLTAIYLLPVERWLATRRQR